MPPLVESGGGETYRIELLRFLFDLGFYFGGYVAGNLHGGGLFAEGFDGFAELDLALVDLEAFGGEGFGPVAGGCRAQELVCFAGLAGETDTLPVAEIGV